MNITERALLEKGNRGAKVRRVWRKNLSASWCLFARLARVRFLSAKKKKLHEAFGIYLESSLS